ncbi:reduced folate carrier [Kipferlia bialata]|uniref:Reduced folate carrier n=1 Tax=Kipferlia bialata TaxID=797122 RepID=A0A9K3CS73_9EUKA|nr:reduced folate carrier [Kipferlia bialata]|eukprot:g2434.t1
MPGSERRPLIEQGDGGYGGYGEGGCPDPDEGSKGRKGGRKSRLSLPLSAYYLALAGFLFNFKPSEAFLTPYMINYKGISEDQLVNAIYPIWTYANAVLLVLFTWLCAKGVGYIALLWVGMVARLSTRLILIFGYGMFWMGLSQVTFALTTASDAIYFAAIYYFVQEVEEEREARRTRHTQGHTQGQGHPQTGAQADADRGALFRSSTALSRVSSLSAHLLSAIIGQVLISVYDYELPLLFDMSLVSVSLAVIPMAMLTHRLRGGSGRGDTGEGEREGVVREEREGCMHAEAESEDIHPCVPSLPISSLSLVHHGDGERETEVWEGVNLGDESPHLPSSLLGWEGSVTGSVSEMYEGDREGESEVRHGERGVGRGREGGSDTSSEEKVGEREGVLSLFRVTLPHSLLYLVLVACHGLVLNYVTVVFQDIAPDTDYNGVAIAAGRAAGCIGSVFGPWLMNSLSRRRLRRCHPYTECGMGTDMGVAAPLPLSVSVGGRGEGVLGLVLPVTLALTFILIAVSEGIMALDTDSLAWAFAAYALYYYAAELCTTLLSAQMALALSIHTARVSVPKWPVVGERGDEIREGERVSGTHPQSNSQSARSKGHRSKGMGEQDGGYSSLFSAVAMLSAVVQGLIQGVLFSTWVPSIPGLSALSSHFVEMSVLSVGMGVLALVRH